MNLLTAGVMNGMMGASSYMKMADVSMGVYTQAKDKGDEATMKRALGYTADSMNSAKENSQKAQESLEEAQMQAKEQAKAEQQAALDKKAQETTQVQKAQQQAALDEKAQGTIQAKQQVPDNSTNVDTVEISNEGRLAAQASGQIPVVQDATVQTHTDIPEQSGKTPITEDKTYTSKGNIKSTNIEAKISVSV